jgi:hypothetical protein
MRANEWGRGSNTKVRPRLKLKEKNEQLKLGNIEGVHVRGTCDADFLGGAVRRPCTFWASTSCRAPRAVGLQRIWLFLRLTIHFWTRRMAGARVRWL